MGGFGLESGADDLLDRAAIVSGLRGVLLLCPGETSSIQRLVESAGQEEMARTESLHDTLLANATSLEPADAS
jgi:hypothetical protein